ncbi:HAD-IB family hydrolase [Clostridium sartagoforme]|uniref:HAD-IB family hydrolase n=1 Tax=Clostridium sartagoforme TaxID=84031 RepID=A0A4V3RLH5_9CLOT|nr:HAD-IB family hydrolase [Clostridium sartagoforme]TGY43760.1 HAD-IB family hydrolase [Clostridium sartagoforme]
MEKLAIFDVDFTLTKKETLMELYKFVVFKNFKNIRFLPRALFSGLMYSIKVYDEKRVKESFLKFIDKIHEEDLDNLAKEYYSKVLKKILYKDAIDMIKKLKDEGCKIYLISASPEFYLKELYDIKEVDVIIGTKFRVENGFFARQMDGLNCKGEEKVRRLKEYLKENNIEVDYKNSYMFSDSLSDKPLLDLVGNPYLINYKKKNDFKVLNWK